MDLRPWKVDLKPGWDTHFKKFDRLAQDRIIKKLDQMEQPLQARGLHSSKYHIEEAGQYRIAYEQNEETRIKEVHFVGNHKQYEKWYREQ